MHGVVGLTVKMTGRGELWHTKEEKKPKHKGVNWETLAKISNGSKWSPSVFTLIKIPRYFSSCYHHIQCVYHWNISNSAYKTLPQNFHTECAGNTSGRILNLHNTL